jgi:serine/threonine protein kinase
MGQAFTLRYKLLERIAIGGTAEVFHAQILATEGQLQPVVIKRILPQFARDPRFRRLFHEEACVAIGINHPNIVRVLDHGELEETCYIAFERVDGKDLGYLLERAHANGQLLAPGLAAYVTVQIAEALQFIHERTSSEGTPLKIIHRDVSPQNILVSFEGDVKLTDFGIAKSAIRQETTVDGTLRGKLDYMAPEQAALGQVDHRTDLFALGCVLYRMLQGIAPFRGENEIETLERLRFGKMIVPAEAIAAPSPLRTIVKKALEKNPDERYQHAQEMGAELLSFIAQEPCQPSRDALGHWIKELRQTTLPASENEVERAVRQLLGQSIEGEAASLGSSTSVFADSRPRPVTPLPLDDKDWRPSEKDKRQRGEKWTPIHFAIIFIAGLGICGWLLWALRYFSSESSSAATVMVNHDSVADAHWVHSSRGPDGATSVLMTPKDAAVPKWSVRSRPSGAIAYINRQRIGVTPLFLPKPSPPFLLEIRKAGHQSWSRQFQVGPFGPSIMAILVPQEKGVGYVTINSLPWSRVEIDGTYIGNTPLRQKELLAGQHRLVLLASDKTVRKSLIFELKPGENRRFTFDFVR